MNANVQASQTTKVQMRKIGIHIQAIIILLIIAAAFSLSPSYVYAAESTTIQINGTCNYAQAKQVYEQTNAQRVKAGKSKLAIDKNLEATAMQRAAECALFYSHTRPNNTKCWTAFPSSYMRTVAENIACGYTNANAVMNGWMNSPGHKANIMIADLQSIGVGAFTVNGTTFWVQVFSSVEAQNYTWQANKTAAYNVSVAHSNLGKLTVTPSATTTLTVGKTLQLKTSMTNKGYSYASAPVSPSYSSSNTKVATVTNSGKVKALGAGTAKITAKLGDKSASVTIDVLKSTTKAPTTITTKPKTKATTTTITFVRNRNPRDNTNIIKSYSTGKSGQKLFMPNWNKTGYSFIGWNTSRMATSAKYKAKYAITDTWVKSNAPKKTYYAIWKANTYTIKFVANGGTGGMTSIQATYDVVKTLPTNKFTRTGYTFNGWNTRADGKGNAYTNKASIKNLVSSGTITLYAQWKKIVPVTNNPKTNQQPSSSNKEQPADTNAGSIGYIAYYSGNGGAVGHPIIPYGSKHVIQESYWNFKGLEFTGWNTKEDGTGKQYEVGQEIIVNFKRLNLYAQWKEIENYIPEPTGNIIYHLNNYWDPTYKHADLKIGAKEIIHKNADWAEHDNRRFINWNTSADGTGDIYEPGQTIIVKEGTLELYAQWESIKEQNIIQI